MTTADAIVLLRDVLLLLALLLLPLALTWAMFQNKSSLLGFPCLIFWSILGGYCYQQSAAAWDINYLMFFGSFGMAIFTAFAAYALRTKKEELAEGDEFIDEGKDDMVFIDEGKPDDTGDEPVSSQRKALRGRADKRRGKW